MHHYFCYLISLSCSLIRLNSTQIVRGVLNKMNALHFSSHNILMHHNWHCLTFLGQRENLFLKKEKKKKVKESIKIKLTWRETARHGNAIKVLKVI